jgi:hypothetical protein
MTSFEFNWLVYVALTGYRGLIKMHYGDIDRYNQRGMADQAVSTVLAPKR